jgi:hypothetical protein
MPFLRAHVLLEGILSLLAHIFSLREIFHSGIVVLFLNRQFTIIVGRCLFIFSDQSWCCTNGTSFLSSGSTSIASLAIPLKRFKRKKQLEGNQFSGLLHSPPPTAMLISGETCVVVWGTRNCVFPGTKIT